MSWAILLQIAKALYKDHQEKEKNAAEMAALAKILRDSNSALVEEMSRLINTAFSSQKLTECDNRLQALEIFYGEYSNNPADFDKLKTIEQECQFILSILDDEDIRLSGISTYMGAASLRINALLLKADTQPGELQNAKDLAKRSADHVDGVIPELTEGAESRIRSKLIRSNTLLHFNKLGTTCSGVSSYVLDGKKVVVDHYLNISNHPRRALPDFVRCRNSVQSSLQVGLDAAFDAKKKQLIEALPVKDLELAKAEWLAI